MSHTVKVSVEFKDRTSLAAAVVAMGGTVQGEGVHKLYSSQERGFGFSLPNWKFPLILRHDDNSLAFDDYHGSWGNVADLVTLRETYTIEVARQAATNNGWISEVQPAGELLIYYPDGGTFTVFKDGTVDANGFTGVGCDVAAKIENALGAVTDRSNKVEYHAERATVLE